MAQIDLSVVASGVALVATGYAALLRYTLKRERESLEAKIQVESSKSIDGHNALKARVATLEADCRAKDAELAVAIAKVNADLGTRLDAALVRIVDLEKNAIRVDGEIKLLRQAHDGITRDLDEIKKQQVPRAEWERQMLSVEKTLSMILERLDERDVRAKNGDG